MKFDAGPVALRETADRFLFVVDRQAVGIDFFLGTNVPRSSSATTS
jgi:hypothetical protein